MEFINVCAICYENFDGKETARPDICNHVFCFPCLQKWGKLESWCPIDKKRFRKIVNLSTAAKIQIKRIKRKRRKILYDITSHCEVCSKDKKNDILILCDCCDLGYHLTCLTPRLSEVPPGFWNCPVCVAVSEKLKSEKSIPKGVDIVENRENLSLLVPSESFSLKINQENNQSSRSKIKTSFPKPETEITSKNKKISNDDPPSSEKKNVNRKISYLDEKITEKVLNESQSLASADSGSSIIYMQNQSIKVENLRPKHFPFFLYDNSCDLPDTSHEFDIQNKFPEKCFTHPENSNNVPLASSESDECNILTATESNKTGFIKESFPKTCSVDKTVSEAIEVSSDVSCNDVMDFNVCIIPGSFSYRLKDNNNASSEIIENAHVVTNAYVPITLSDKHSNASSFQIFEDNDETSVISALVSDHQKPITKENPGDIPYLSTFLNELSNEDAFPILNTTPTDAKDNQLNAQKADSYKMFTHNNGIFGKLEDEGLAKKKYAAVSKEAETIALLKELNAMERKYWGTPRCKICGGSCYTYRDLCLGKNFCRKMYSGNFQERQSISKSSLNLTHTDTKENQLGVRKTGSSKMLSRDKGIFKKLEDEEISKKKHATVFKDAKAIALSKKLDAMERQYWGTPRCKRCGGSCYTYRDLSLGKNRCRKMYSNNFKESQSILKLLRPKPKFDQKDIHNRVRRDDKICSTVPDAAVDFHNNQFSDLRKYPTSFSVECEVEYPHHEIISFENEGLQGLIKTRRRLVRATLSLSKLKDSNCYEYSVDSIQFLS